MVDNKHLHIVPHTGLSATGKPQTRKKGKLAQKTFPNSTSY
jgi:hypothetical protein